MAGQSNLVGYVRMNEKKNIIKLSLKKEDLEKCQTYTNKKGEVFIPLTIFSSDIQDIHSGTKEFAKVTQYIANE